MKLATLPDGRLRYEHAASRYAMTFPRGWTVNTEFAGHDLQATCGDADRVGVLGINVFTQFMPVLAEQSREDFLDNFGIGDFSDMVLRSFSDSFTIDGRGAVPERQRQHGSRIWFEGDYDLVGRQSGALVALRYDLTFEAGRFYHFKSYLNVALAESAAVVVEAVVRGVEIG